MTEKFPFPRKRKDKRHQRRINGTVCLRTSFNKFHQTVCRVGKREKDRTQKLTEQKKDNGKNIKYSNLSRSFAFRNASSKLRCLLHARADKDARISDDLANQTRGQESGKLSRRAFFRRFPGTLHRRIFESTGRSLEERSARSGTCNL